MQEIKLQFVIRVICDSFTDSEQLLNEGVMMLNIFHSVILLARSFLLSITEDHLMQFL